MTLNELKNRLASERHITGGLQIVCGEKCESSIPCFVLGIYEENGVWYVYETLERGGILVLAEGSENDMTEELYRRVLKEEKWCLYKEEQMRNYPKTKDGPFAIYQGKTYTSGVDENGKVVLRSTDIEDVDNGFEECKPFKYKNQEKFVVCMKRVEPQEIEKYYRTYTIAHYCDFEFGVVDENEQEVLIMAVDGNRQNWIDLGMQVMSYGRFKKWVNKSEVRLELIEETLNPFSKNVEVIEKTVKPLLENEKKEETEKTVNSLLENENEEVIEKPIKVLLENDKKEIILKRIRKMACKNLLKVLLLALSVGACVFLIMTFFGDADIHAKLMSLGIFTLLMLIFMIDDFLIAVCLLFECATLKKTDLKYHIANAAKIKPSPWPLHPGSRLLNHKKIEYDFEGKKRTRIIWANVMIRSKDYRLLLLVPENKRRNIYAFPLVDFVDVIG